MNSPWKNLWSIPCLFFSGDNNNNKNPQKTDPVSYSNSEIKYEMRVQKKHKDSK